MYTKLRTMSTDWGITCNQSGELALVISMRGLYLLADLFFASISSISVIVHLFSLAVKLCELD